MYLIGDVNAVCNEIVDSLVEYLTQRFSIDCDKTDVLEPFAKLNSEANVKNVHHV